MIFKCNSQNFFNQNIKINGNLFKDKEKDKRFIDKRLLQLILKITKKP